MNGEIHYAPFERPLKTPFAYGSARMESRRGFLLRKSQGNSFAYAEASPLPGHSLDTYADVENALAQGGGSALPSLNFALECLARSPMPIKQFVVRSNALVPESPPAELEEKIRLASQTGYSCCKLKISPFSVSALPTVLEKFLNMKFRLDANRSLNPTLLEALSNELESRGALGRIDYLEEPFDGIWQDKAFRKFQIPLAADESAADPKSARRLLSSSSPPSIFVIKPTVFGGFKAVASFLAELKDSGSRGVITTALETETGRRAILSYLSSEPHEVAGLSTGLLFRENYLEDQATWNSIPAISSREQAWLDSLPWKAAAC